MSEIKVFISYSHDSNAHRERVLGLSERLRRDGVVTFLDLYVQGGSPAEDWPRWMLAGLDAATHVLCVCTETYQRRFLGQDVPEQGKGVDWEGALITQALYDARSRSNKFIPVLFAPGDAAFIPAPLRGRTHYLLDADANYEALYDTLLEQSGVQAGAVGELRRKARTTGQPLSFSTAAPAPVAAPGSAALRIWQEKLDFLLVEEAVCANPDMKFSLKHLINEARDKIRALGG